MSALAVNAAIAAPAPTTIAAPAASPAEDAGFGALLGEMARPKTSADNTPPDAAAKGKSAPAKATDASTLTALQSLEAALNGLGTLATPPAPAAAPVKAATTPTAAAATAPLGSAIAAAAGAIDTQAWDASGKTPLKSLLQSDPSLGMSGFQMKTFLAASGATPARAGATALGADSAWSPLAPGKSAATATASQASAAASSAHAGTVARAAAPRAAEMRDGHAAAPLPVAGAGGAVSAVSSGSPAGGGNARDNGGDKPPDAKSSGATTAVSATVSNAAAATPSLTVPLANLPVFIADQASALTASAADAPSAATSASAATTTPKAAQAVKELNITLDPADLGQMTLKLRLAGGKLSVTIGVVNPKTLTSIEDDRALIAARLGAGDQTLADLVIQRQAGAPSTQETASSHALASDTGADPSASDSEAESSNPGGRRGGSGGAFSDRRV